MSIKPMTRRTALVITASAACQALLAPKFASATYTQKGFALGSEAQITLHGFSRETAIHLSKLAMVEVARLENVFSLYRRDSELSCLNRTGELAAPSHDFRTLLHRSLGLWKQTEGAFNPAIQPLWRHLAEHFEHSPQQQPDQSRLLTLAELCQTRKIREDGTGIKLAPGMALSFNGIAQGYITDQVTSILRRERVRNILLQLGETKALPGRAWRIGIPNSQQPIKLANSAIATSVPAATRFDSEGEWNHLIDPKTGRSANNMRSISVIAPDATTADALSTALAVCPDGRRKAIVSRFATVSVFGVLANGRKIKI